MFRCSGVRGLGARVRRGWSRRRSAASSPRFSISPSLRLSVSLSSPGGGRSLTVALLFLALLGGGGAWLAGAQEAARPQNRQPPAWQERATAAYEPVRPGYRYEFPRDLAAHPEFRTEWWYYTGHLEAGGRRYGFELTFFRAGIDPERKESPSAWALHTVYFAHLAITDEERGRFYFAEAAQRPALGMAGADAARYRVWIDDWSASLEGETHRLRAAAEEIALELDLTPLKPPVIHGTDGVSRKSTRTEHASHYFTLPRLAVAGRIRLPGGWREVTGSAWLDREFFSTGLPPHVDGWDWFAVQLDDGRELMLYLLRQEDGRLEPASAGTLVERDGTSRHLTLADFEVEATGRWRSPHSGATYPHGWRVRVPAAELEITVTPTAADQELHLEGAIPVTYWEGSCEVRGTAAGRPVTGRAYVELSGYAGPLGGRF